MEQFHELPSPPWKPWNSSTYLRRLNGNHGTLPRTSVAFKETMEHFHELLFLPWLYFLAFSLKNFVFVLFFAVASGISSCHRQDASPDVLKRYFKEHVSLFYKHFSHFKNIINIFDYDNHIEIHSIIQEASPIIKETYV